VAQARRLLSALARAHLIRPVGPARYAMHDLLRVYAAELAVGCDSDRQETTAASARPLRPCRFGGDGDRVPGRIVRDVW
jgi:hypothetical protein